MSESPAAIVVGSIASVVLLLSSVPRILRGSDRAVPPTSVAFLLLPGLLWLAYGVLQAATTVLVFFSLSTAVQVLMVVTSQARTRGRSRVTVLVGGGTPLAPAAWSLFRSRVAWCGARVLVLTDAAASAEDREANFAEARARLGRCARHGRPEDLERAEAVWLAGGDPGRLLAALRPHSEAVCACPLVGGTSAGALVLRRLGRAGCPVGVHGKDPVGGGTLTLEEHGAICLDEDGAILDVAGRVRLSCW